MSRCDESHKKNNTLLPKLFDVTWQKQQEVASGRVLNGHEVFESSGRLIGIHLSCEMPLKSAIDFRNRVLLEGLHGNNIVLQLQLTRDKCTRAVVFLILELVERHVKL